MAFATHQMMVGATIEVKDALARTSNAIVKLSDLYAHRIETARLRAGNMFADPLIAGDFGICKGCFKSFDRSVSCLDAALISGGDRRVLAKQSPIARQRGQRWAKKQTWGLRVRRLKTRVDGETLLHKSLWRVVVQQIEQAAADPRCSFSDSLAAMVFTSHALEAYLNFVGDRLDPEFWKNERHHFRQTGFDGKLLKVLELCGINEPNRDDRPYSTVWKLKKLRDRIAHAKPERFSATEHHSADTQPDLYSEPLDGLVTQENAVAAAKDIEEFADSIHAAAKPRVHDVVFGTKAFRGILQHSTGHSEAL